MTDLIEYIKLEDARKHWNKTISQFDDTVQKCKVCGGPLEEIMFTNEVVGVEYDQVCKNPDCIINR